MVLDFLEFRRNETGPRVAKHEGVYWADGVRHWQDEGDLTIVRAVGRTARSTGFGVVTLAVTR